MIGYLRGVVRERETSGVILDVGGIGWLLRCPMSTFLDLTALGETAELLVTTHVREDAITLYGFATSAERMASFHGSESATESGFAANDALVKSITES